MYFNKMIPAKYIKTFWDTKQKAKTSTQGKNIYIYIYIN